MSGIDTVVELAIGAAGPVGNNVRAWQLRVAENTMLIAAMMRPGQQGHEEDATTPLVTARKVLDASVFRAEFVGFTVEEHRKRLEVSFRSSTTDAKEAEADGTEKMVTEPWWTESGQVMRKLIEGLQPGTPVNVFKYIEPIEGGRKKMRVLVHLQVAGRPPQATGSRPADEGRPPAVPSQAERPAPRRDPAPVGEPPPAGNAVVQERFNALTTRQQIAFAHLCRSQGITNFMDPDDEHLDAVLLNLSHVEKGE